MSGRASPDVQIEFAGQPYTLRFSVKALAAMQDHWQLDSLDAVAAKLAGIDEHATVDDYTAILWAALRTHHRDVTMEHALDFIDEMGLEGFMEALSETLAGSSAEGGGDASANPPARGRSRGSSNSAGRSVSRRKQ